MEALLPQLNPRLVDAYCNRCVTWLALDKVDEAEADIACCRAMGGKLKPEAAALLREMKQRIAKKPRKE